MKINYILLIFNKIYKKFGHKSNAKTPGQLLIDALVKKQRAIKFIQVGANDGIRFDTLYSTVTDQGWSGIVIEPITKYFVNLVNNYKNYPNIIPINCAIHPELKEAKIYRVQDSVLDQYPIWIDGCASMNRDHLIRAGALDNHIIESTVECCHIMDLVNKYGMTDADYLQIDTEGFDAEVLKLIDFNIFRPLVIKFEWKHLSLKDQAAIKNLLQSKGYTLEIHKDGQDCSAYLNEKIAP